MLTTTIISSTADEDLHLPGDDGVVGADVDNTEDAVDEVNGWKRMPTSIFKEWETFFFAFVSLKMDYFKDCTPP